MTQNPLLAGASGGLQPNSLFDDYASSFGAAVPNGAADWAAEQVRQQRAQSVSMGLLDPNTGWPTTAGWKGAAQQYANGLLMGSTAPRGNGLLAYHGSPHDFDAFSVDKIGSGEGAQTYGHGLYFAQNEGVARQYRDALSGARPNPELPQAQADYNAKWSAIGDLYDKGASKEEIGAAIAERDAALAKVQELKSAPTEPVPGRMYEVNLNVQPHELLDWDKPLSEQPIGDKLRQIAPEHLGLTPYQTKAGNWEYVTPEAQGERVFARSDQPVQSVADLLGNMTGQQAYEAFRGMAPDYSQVGATDFLQKSLGTKGIRYLDQGSRGSGEGTSNFVMFDPATIEILRKYGIAGLGLGTAAAAADQPTTP